MMFHPLRMHPHSERAQHQSLHPRRHPPSEGGIDVAMNNIAAYFYDINDNDNAKKYYVMAIDQGNVVAMNNIAFLYWKIGDIENMKKYFLMAIDRGYNDANYHFGNFYFGNEEYDKAIPLYMNYVSNGNAELVDKLPLCIEKCNAIDEFIQCWKSQVITDNDDIIDLIIHFIDNNIVNDELINIFINIKLAPSTKNVYKMLQSSLVTKINLIDLHFNYTPNADGCKSAKRDFINRL